MVDFTLIYEQKYRCYEHGTGKETLACGTGVIANAAVATRLKLLRTDNLRLWSKSSCHCDAQT